VFDERLFKEALIKASRVPLQYAPINLHDSSDTSFSATKAGFAEKANALSRNFRDMFGRIHDQEAVAVFALAPQPLLIKLGTLINDQYNAQVFQCHREGHKWAWKDDSKSPEFIINESGETAAVTVALVIDLSAEIINDRITSVLGADAAIVHLTVAMPNRNFVTNPSVQTNFVEAFRQVIEAIKNRPSHPSIIHVFPAMPNSLAVNSSGPGCSTSMA
jgi:hypothetical protein